MDTIAYSRKPLEFCTHNLKVTCMTVQQISNCDVACYISTEKYLSKYTLFPMSHFAPPRVFACVFLRWNLKGAVKEQHQNEPELQTKLMTINGNIPTRLNQSAGNRMQRHIHNIVKVLKTTTGSVSSILENIWECIFAEQILSIAHPIHLSNASVSESEHQARWIEVIVNKSDRENISDLQNIQELFSALTIAKVLLS